jgi:hypothetical protein
MKHSRWQQRARGVRLAGLTLSVWALSACLGHANGSARYEPEKGCYVGAYVELDDNAPGDLDSFEKATGKVHATYFRYVGWGQPFPFQWVQQLKTRGAAAHLAWEPNDGLAQVRDDDYLHGWAQAASRSGCPIFLRYASEMNGNWQAYSGDPDAYIAKWRMVYRIMHEEAPNVVMVWCPFATPRATIPLYYPGDDYVDWVGVNIYSVLHEDGDPAKPASDDPRSLLRYVYDLFAYRKPIAVCEYAAGHYNVAGKVDSTDFALDNMTKIYAALAKDFPRVRMINWFSVDTTRAALADNNYSLTSNPRVLEAYAKLVSGDYFLSQVAPAKVEPVLPSGPAVAAPPVGVVVKPPTVPPSTTPPPSTSAVALAATKLGLAQARGVMIVIQGSSPTAVKGRVDIVADMGREVTGDTATFNLDGRFIAITNVVPYRFSLDADRLEPGDHILKVSVGTYGENATVDAQARIVVVR